MMRPRPAIPALLLACLLLGAGDRAIAAGEHGTVFSRSYRVELQGAHAGWMRLERHPHEAGVVTEQAFELVLRRAGEELTFRGRSEVVETDDGRPVSAHSQRSLGAGKVRERIEFHEDHAVRQREEGGRVREDRVDLPGGVWLPPAAAADYVRRRLEAGSPRIVVRRLDPLSGLTPVLTAWESIERTEFESGGRTGRAHRASVRSSAAPGMRTVEIIDPEGVALRSESVLGGLRVVLVVDPDAAHERPDAPPDLMAGLVVLPDGAAVDPRNLRDAVYILDVEDAAEGHADRAPPCAGSQRVERLGPGRYRVHVAPQHGPRAAERDQTPETYLRPSGLVDSADPKIRALANAADPGRDQTCAARAEALRRAVHAHITDKTLGVGFASASEAVRTRAGDCTEHAVLLAAVLRAAGIPARVVTGLAYTAGEAGVPEGFAYHMWTQALIEDGGTARWIDLDATLGPERAFDAGRIALGVSAMTDDEPLHALAGVAPLLRRIAVTIEDAASEGASR